MFPSSRRSVFRSLLAGRQLLIGTLMISAIAWAIGEPSWQGLVPVMAADATVAEREDEPPPAIPVRASEKQIKAFSGLAALAGIVISGLALVALIILWAGRLRRQLRRPLPECDAPGRDFWFLKPPKPTVTQSSLPDSHQPPRATPPASGSD